MGLVALGPFTVALAFASSLASVGLSLAAAARADDRTSRWARRAFALASAALTWALVALAAALWRGDWSLVYVADHASRATRWPYRLSALWAGMAGSLLVWAWFLAAWGLAVSRWCRRRCPLLAPTAQGVMAGLVALFSGLLVWVDPPFARLAIPAIDGGGLTPVLRHPAMLYHPPLLYAGAVGLAVPFALAVAGRGGTAWLVPARRWALAGLALLTAGMVAGAHWAYVELGWGGYWAWDPVENGALLPWLAGVAFVHATLGAQRDGGAGGSGARAAALATATFALGLFGAFLTRSGATSSVHAFAEAEAVGRVLGTALVALLGAWGIAARVARRRPIPLPPPGPHGHGPPERWITANLALVGSLTVVVAVGTALPLVWRVATGERLIVEGRYYALVSWPLALALLATVGPALRSGRHRWPVGTMLAGAAGGVALLAAGGARGAFPLTAAALGGASAGAVVAEIARRGRRPAAAAVAGHLGVVILLVGVAGTTATDRRSGPVGPTQDLKVGGYVLRLEEVVPIGAGGPGAAVRAEVVVEQGGEQVATLRPEALVSARGERVSVAGLRSTPLEDVMVVIRSVAPDGESAVVEASVLPLAAWLWWGGLLVAAALALAAARSKDGDRAPGPVRLAAPGRVGGPPPSAPQPVAGPAPSPSAPGVASPRFRFNRRSSVGGGAAGG